MYQTLDYSSYMCHYRDLQSLSTEVFLDITNTFDPYNDVSEDPTFFSMARISQAEYMRIFRPLTSPRWTQMKERMSWIQDHASYLQRLHTPIRRWVFATSAYDKRLVTIWKRIWRLRAQSLRRMDATIGVWGLRCVSTPFHAPSMSNTTYLCMQTYQTAAENMILEVRDQSRISDDTDCFIQESTRWRRNIRIGSITRRLGAQQQRRNANRWIERNPSWVMG